MNGVEIEKWLQWVDKTSKENAAIQISEIFSYLQKHMESVAIDMAATGHAAIPTSFGPYTVYYQDLVNALLPDPPIPPKSSFWKRALSIFKGEA